MNGDLPFRKQRKEKTGVESSAFDFRRDPVGIGYQQVRGEKEIFPVGQLCQRQPSLMEFPTTGVKADGRFRSGGIETAAAFAACEKNTRLFKGLTDRGHKKTESDGFGKVVFLKETLCVRGAESGDTGGQLGIQIRFIQTAPGEDKGPAHEGLVPPAPHQKELIRRVRPVTEQNNRRGRARRSVCPAAIPALREYALLFQGISRPYFASRPPSFTRTCPVM